VTRDRSGVTRFGDVDESHVAVERLICYNVLLITGSVGAGAQIWDLDQPRTRFRKSGS